MSATTGPRPRGAATATDPAGLGHRADRLVALVGMRSQVRAIVVPVVLGALAVCCQVVYPLVSGDARDRITVATVVLFAGASLTHALVTRGLRTAAVVAAVFVGGGLAVEVVGVATGVPFGEYAYADRLGPQVGGVPLLIPLAWVMLGYPALVVARRITGSRWAGPLVGAAALATWDLFLDPQMVAEGYWTWTSEGPHLIGTVPVTNYLAWLGIAWLMMLAAWPTARRFAAIDDDRVPVALYAWTWIGSTVAHLLLLDLPRSGVYGGVAMGLVMLGLLRRTAARPAG